MARFSMEAPILGVQITNVEGKIYAKVFVGEEPDNVTEAITSITTMSIREECADEVFAAVRNLPLGQMVRMHIETERGGKQSTKNVVLHIEPVQAANRNQPGQQNSPIQGQSPSKPVEPAKA